MRSIRISTIALCLCLASASLVSGQTLLPTFRLLQDHITGLSAPLLLTHAGDGTRRKFIVEQGGIIKVVQPGSTTPTQFINLDPIVLSGGERGLLGLAFHPNFETNSYFFVNYTRNGDGATVISRFTATNNNTIGDPNSERILLVITQPFSNHNGGGIEFGPDGNLYIGMGDGGSGNDPGSRAQNINDLLGKFLRITPDVSGVNTNPAYTNPPDNPYVGIAGADEIYAIGLRNPFRWSFDRGGSNQLWAGDVGQGNWEEVSVINRGGNYGWRAYEGFACTGLDPNLCTGGANPIVHSQPVLNYSSASPNPECSITGGYVYRGVLNSRTKGEYIFGDYCSGKIWSWFNSQQIQLIDTARNITSFGQDEDGELYVVGGGGTIDKVLNNKPSADFGGDLTTDISVFRPSTGVWYVRNSQNGSVGITGFGLPGDIPVAKDYDGDLKSDIAVFRPSNGTWYMLRSSDSTFGALNFGLSGDVPAAGDYDGDGKADFTLFRPSTGVWYQLRSTDFGFSAFNFGLNGDVPTPGDFDGDGRYDFGVFRQSNATWYRLNSTNPTNTIFIPFGLAGDIPSQGDFDGDGLNDIAVFRPSNGTWYISRTLFGGAVQITNWGLNGDIPVVGDYDGDSRDDIAVFRPSTGVWYALRSTNSTMLAIPFGIAEDLPIPHYDKP
jgi:Glucose/sorbosone dehydrogenases